MNGTRILKLRRMLINDHKYEKSMQMDNNHIELFFDNI